VLESTLVVRLHFPKFLARILLDVVRCNVVLITKNDDVLERSTFFIGHLRVKTLSTLGGSLYVTRLDHPVSVIVDQAIVAIGESTFISREQIEISKCVLEYRQAPYFFRIHTHMLSRFGLLGMDMKM
jgi:hypothetical protein